MSQLVKNESFAGVSLEKSAELAAIAVAAAAKAEVESAYVMAIKSPRDEEEARVKIKRACQHPGFAAKAIYRKPVGGKFIDGRYVPNYVQGPSIRFAEQMLLCWKNVLTQQTTIYDDDSKRLVKISTRDLESNVSFSKELTLGKSVERKQSKDRDVLGQRRNTKGEIVFIVRATEDELLVKESAEASKVIRTQGLRLIPQHIIDEALAEAQRVIREKISKDPDAEKRELLDGFASRGILPHELEAYLNDTPNAKWTPAQLLKLREMLTTIQDGAATWQEFIEPTPEADKQDMEEKSQPGTKGQEILEAKHPALSKGTLTMREEEKQPAGQGFNAAGQPLSNETGEVLQQDPVIATLVDGSVEQLRKLPGGGPALMKLWQQYKLATKDFGKLRASELLKEPELALFGNEVQQAIMEIERKAKK